MIAKKPKYRGPFYFLNARNASPGSGCEARSILSDVDVSPNELKPGLSKAAGEGPGPGIARRSAAGGYRVVMLARSAENLAGWMRRSLPSATTRPVCRPKSGANDDKKAKGETPRRIRFQNVTESQTGEKINAYFQNCGRRHLGYRVVRYRYCCERSGDVNGRQRIPARSSVLAEFREVCRGGQQARERFAHHRLQGRRAGGRQPVCARPARTARSVRHHVKHRSVLRIDRTGSAGADPYRTADHRTARERRG